jgi:hypothetical protein
MYPPVLDPASAVIVSGPGNAVVGAFQVAVPAPGSFTWTNRTSVRVIDRSQNLALNWSGGGTGTVLVWGGNYDQPVNGGGSFVCTGAASAGSLTVPAYILQGLPASEADLTKSAGYVRITVLPASLTPFTANGIAGGLALWLGWMDRAVFFQ